MGKKLDAIIGKCKLKAHILESKQAVELTIDVEKNPKQKVWIGKKSGDIYKIPNVNITYKIEAPYHAKPFIRPLVLSAYFLLVLFFLLS